MAHRLTHSLGHWMPRDRGVVEQWLGRLIDQVTRDPKPLHPIIADFKALIEDDPEIYMLFHMMFDEVPEKYRDDPTGAPQVRDYHLMLQLFNEIMTRAPEYMDNALVGFPINAILDWPMGTSAGFAAFLNPKVNAQFQVMLGEWARFLGSPDSLYVLNKDPKTGWFGSAAMKKMPNFSKNFVCNPRAPYHGFTSWDDFFTRQFRPGIRPVADPDDDQVIVNACESGPYCLARGVKPRDRFWLKGQPYSLDHMLARDSLAPQFAGGTVYQAFLDALSYHRWHSPVRGRVTKAYVRPGTYYSEAQSEGFDPAGPNNSQGYITQVATRAMIFIEADNPAIGLMCFMAVGMAEVSTCDIRVYEGQRVDKGDQLGMFHFGGSTHCLIFRPGLKLDFDFHGQKPNVNATPIPVNAKIARVVKG
ncbi:MAG TPA: phosphatidylserine decarboxylase family protein [Allosphingosinicella sp.]|nr:phosphatidylserine decarboxylase family protein [Allosphingosinicella sp.]